MMVRIKVKASPYKALKRNTVGEVTGVKFRGTSHEVWQVRLEDGTMWSLYPDELKMLNGEPV